MDKLVERERLREVCFIRQTELETAERNLEEAIKEYVPQGSIVDVGNKRNGTLYATYERVIVGQAGGHGWIIGTDQDGLQRVFLPDDIIKFHDK